MLPYNARTNSQGFTMTEVTIVLIIVGILSAISAPSFLSMLNRNKVNNALTEVQGSLREAQRESIRKSKNCTVIVPTGNNITLTSPAEDTNANGSLDTGEDTNGNGKLDNNNCLLTGNRKLEGVGVRSSNSSITFDFKGNVGIGSGSLIVIASSDSSITTQKCLAIPSGIGIMRTGNYDETDTTGTDSNKCTTSQ